MKYFIIHLILISIFNFPSQEKILQGEFKMNYEEDYASHNGIITIKNNKYKKVLPDGKVLKGNVLYEKSKIILIDKKSDLQVELYSHYIQRDTIPFRTSRINEVPEKGDIIIFSGKMIRIKS